MLKCMGTQQLSVSLMAIKLRCRPYLPWRWLPTHHPRGLHQSYRHTHCMQSGFELTCKIWSMLKYNKSTKLATSQVTEKATDYAAHCRDEFSYKTGRRQCTAASVSWQVHRTVALRNGYKSNSETSGSKLARHTAAVPVTAWHRAASVCSFCRVETVVDWLPSSSLLLSLPSRPSDSKPDCSRNLGHQCIPHEIQ